MADRQDFEREKVSMMRSTDYHDYVFKDGVGTKKTMIIAIQQPEHLPWIGFFNKMASADEFIYLDNVQFKKRYFENRNKIRTNTRDNWAWITVPVITKGLQKQEIKEVKIDYEQQWQRRYLNALRHNYCKAGFYDEIFPEVEKIISGNFKTLLELNLILLDFIRGYLGIEAPARRASEICPGKGSGLILSLCIMRKADVYLSGPDGRNYLVAEEFKKNNIEIKYHDYEHPVYEQMHKPFISHMSILDLLFNHGRESLSIIKERDYIYGR